MFKAFQLSIDIARRCVHSPRNVLYRNIKFELSPSTSNKFENSTPMAVAAEEHPLFERDVKEAVASSNFIILFNVNDVIGPLPSHIPFMKRYAHNTEMALSKFL